MASPTRQALKDWLNSIEVKGKVLDVGGIACPMRNQIIDKGITEYKILDKVLYRKDVRTDYIYDLEHFIGPLDWLFDVAFCTEVMQFIYNPVRVLNNINSFLENEALLYITFHLTQPPMKGEDYLRYTKKGVEKLLRKTKFHIEYIKEPINGYYLVKAEVSRRYF